MSPKAELTDIEHVATLPDGKGGNLVVLITSRGPIINGAIQLEFDERGNMQFSPQWIDYNVNKLPLSSKAKKEIPNAHNIATLVAGVDVSTGEFTYIKVDARKI